MTMPMHFFLTLSISASLLGFAIAAHAADDAAALPAFMQQEREAGTTTNSAGGVLGIGLNQFVQMAEEAANDLVFSRAFEKRIANPGSPPRLVIGNIRNDTDNENILVGDMVQKMREILVRTGAVRVFTADATDFDFVLAPRLTSSTLRSISRKEIERSYSFSFQITTIDGEYITEESVDKIFVERY